MGEGSLLTDSCDAADKALDVFVGKILVYLASDEKLKKDREKLLLFYDFLSAQWAYNKNNQFD
ncbi:MAG: hypothetical protein ACTS85_03360 [Arsenophonus sp. NC-PG7-MAG3]